MNTLSGKNNKKKLRNNKNKPFALLRVNGLFL